jgi:hypothetical protein
VIQPTGKPGVTLTILSSNMEKNFDVLTLTPVSSVPSKVDPASIMYDRSLSLKLFSYKLDSFYNHLDWKLFRMNDHNQAYTVKGSAAIVTFYSDSSTVGTGFDLLWQDAGNNYKHDAVIPKITYLDSENGAQSLKFDGKASEIIVINPKYLDGSGLNLKLNKIVETIGTSGKNGLTVYGNHNGNYSIAQRFFIISRSNVRKS